jgi:hypothetical protein
MRTQFGHRLVIVAGIVLAHYQVGDRMAEAHAMVSVVEQGWADQNDVARSPRTLRRYERRVETGGLAALGRPRGDPTGRARLKAGRLRLVDRLKADGLSNRAVAQRIGVSEHAVRKLLRRVGWRPPTGEQERLPLAPPSAHPNVSAIPALEDIPVSLDRDPADRRLDRLLAYLGLLDDAAPLFRSGERVPHAGVLLALPPLVTSGVFAIAREVYGSLGLAFYGLRTTVVALLLMALLRIKRPEALKEQAPNDLGRLLGLDRAPEVKTLRRKLSRLAASGRATEFGRALARHRVAARGAALGFLYIDRHVRVYLRCRRCDTGAGTVPAARAAYFDQTLPH